VSYHRWTKPEAQEAIKLRDVGYKYKQIASELNEAFATSRTAKKIRQAFSTGAIYRVLGEDEIPLTADRMVMIQNIDGSTSVKSDRPYTDEEMASMFDIDTDVWRVSKRVTNAWAKHFQTKLWWVADDRGIIASGWDQMLDELRAFNVLPSFSSPSLSRGDILYEICIFDAHIGSLAWGEEVGKDYNLDIACRDYKDTFKSLLSRAPKDCKILFPLGQDLFHFDTLIQGKGGATAAGTPQDVDSRWQRMFTRVWRMSMECIELAVASGHEVDVVIVPGNHDTQTSFYLGSLLSAIYAGNLVVGVDNYPRTRKYYRWGNCLIGYTHGNSEKVSELPSIMAREEGSSWGSCEHREWHIGHTHQEKVVESQGAVVRTMMALATADAWHNQKGYVGNRRGGQAFVWCVDSGLLNINYQLVTD